jgi:hypothetical protein
LQKEGIMAEILKSGMAPSPNLATPYWLIEKHEAGLTEALTLGLQGGAEALPVFSFEEEARTFLYLRGLGKGWRVRGVVTGDLLPVLFGTHESAEWVALDPVPEAGWEALTAIVSLSRQSFMERHLGEEEPLAR